MPDRPDEFLEWVPDASPTKIATPTSAARASGWSAGQVPPAQWMNWLFWRIDNWLKFLDGKSAGSTGGAASVSNARLVNGGTWSYVAGTLTWSDVFNVGYPGILDSQNAIAAAAIAIADGQMAYLTGNIPIRHTGTTTSGSANLTNMSGTTGLAAGMSVTATGVPAGTTIVSISGTTITMSANAVNTASAVSITFIGTTAPTVSVAAQSSITPGPATMVIAKRIGDTVVLGVGAGEMILRDGEAKLLRGVGFQESMTATAGMALAAGTPVYISDGDDSGRTNGYAYPTDATASGIRKRANVSGVVARDTASGALATICVRGRVPGYTGLPTGQLIWASTTTAGAIQTGFPPVIGSAYRTLVGMALNPTTIAVSGPQGDVSVSPNPVFVTTTIDVQGQDPEVPITRYQISGSPIIRIGQNVQRMMSDTISSPVNNQPPLYSSSADRMDPASAICSFPANSYTPRYAMPLNLPPQGILNSVQIHLSAYTSYTSGASFKFYIFLLDPRARTSNPFANSWYTTQTITGTSNPSALPITTVTITVNKAIDPGKQFWFRIENNNIGSAGDLRFMEMSAFVKVTHALISQRS